MAVLSWNYAKFKKVHGFAWHGEMDVLFKKSCPCSGQHCSMSTSTRESAWSWVCFLTDPKQRLAFLIFPNQWQDSVLLVVWNHHDSSHCDILLLWKQSIHLRPSELWPPRRRAWILSWFWRIFAPWFERPSRALPGTGEPHDWLALILSSQLRCPSFVELFN